MPKTKANGLTWWSVACLLMLLQLFIGFAHAEKRHPDPDGCFSCHGLPDLKYIDKQGQLRSATILKADYYGSLHGSVPCKDCHRKITDYPHEEKDGLVDCAESCHVKEPSNGKAFTHKDIAKEFKDSAHGKGWTKDFAAGNRAKEDKDSSLPSCRRCHANDPYIAESQMAAFKEAFQHNDAECGTCHAGDVWREQFSGHILRRYIGNRINKVTSNKICIDCHGDIDEMSKVEQEDSLTKEKKPVTPRFIYSTHTYAKTLHGRLLSDGSLQGASCIECHAPEGLHHGIKRDEDPLSAVNELHLSKTCGQSGCHKDYSKSGGSYGFLTTDMHSVSTIALGIEAKLPHFLKTNSNWHVGAVILGVLALVFFLGHVIWRLFNDPDKLSDTKNNSILGAENFQRIIIGSKGKQSKAAKEGIWDRLKRAVGLMDPAPAKPEPKPHANRPAPEKQVTEPAKTEMPQFTKPPAKPEDDA
jgi:sulfite reductase (NADPH) flavoprotein alpha-component